MATMGEALIAFNKMLDDVGQWAQGSTAYEERETGGHIERRDYDIATAARAIRTAQNAIDGDGDEESAVQMLMSVVHAAQWHTVEKGV